MSVAVTAWAVHLPGGGHLGGAPDSCAGPAVPPERAHELLGRRGLLYKEPATRLALCAVHRALGLPPAAPRPDSPPDPGTAVVASSNLGNVATVRRVAETVRRGTVRDVSPLDAPNASSNVIASTVAIWFRLGGPNLTVCSGATSGLDAVALGSLLIRAGRAGRVVVVGAEPDDEVAVALHGRRAAACGGALRAGAAAIVLEAAAPAGAPRLGQVGSAPGRDSVGGRAGASVVVGPAELGRGAGRVIDLVREVGDPYGALGVLQVAVAAALVAGAGAAGPRKVAVICGDDVDGWRTTALLADPPPGRASCER